MGAVRFTEKGRRLLGASHFAHSPEEMKRYYFDVLETGVELGVAMPHLGALRERIDWRAGNLARSRLSAGPPATPD